jgi:hypothetical protein
VIKHYAPGKSAKQADLASQHVGGQDTPFDPKYVLRPRGHYSRRVWHKIIPWNDLVAEIDADRPVLAKVGFHYILLVGYKGRSNRDPNRRYLIRDPDQNTPVGPEEKTADELKAYNGGYEASVFTKP